jgi:hypothetical protein
MRAGSIPAVEPRFSKSLSILRQSVRSTVALPRPQNPSSGLQSPPPVT